MIDQRRVFALDIETTGLLPTHDQICEIGMYEVKMDTLSVVLSTLYRTVIAGDDQIELTLRNGFVHKMHTESGLMEVMYNPPIVMDTKSREYHPATMADTEGDLFDWLTRRIKQPIDPQAGMNDRPVLLGSSVHFDRAFIAAWMPKIDKLFHYRHIDVSSIKELVSKWYPDGDEIPDFAATGKWGKPHRTIPDLGYTLDELRYYREYYFYKAGMSESGVSE